MKSKFAVSSNSAMGRNSFEIHPALVYLFVVSFSKKKSARLDKELKTDFIFFSSSIFLLKEKKIVLGPSKYILLNTILYILKFDDYLKILTDDEVKDSIAINISEYFQSTREEQNFWKVAKSLYIFLTTAEKVEKYVQLSTSDNFDNGYYI